MRLSRTVGELKESGYQGISVKNEIRNNLIRSLCQKEPLFPEMVGYQETVINQMINALLARQDLLLLGRRGQGKTMLLRLLIQLLDPLIPVLAESELNDDPVNPISSRGKEILATLGDSAPIVWLERDRRYVEKLATPDVTVADLLGDIDISKHLQGRTLADADVLHYGLIPRANRGIFCLNELPDLSPRIQVGLFNALQEKDLQIRGQTFRLPLDILMVFSANPEDYTRKGRIVTPLKDRIGSVIQTHYPATRADGIQIQKSNAWLSRDSVPLWIPQFIMEIIEEMTRLARKCPQINPEAGVSVRLAISGIELVASNAEKRALSHGDPLAVPRINDLAALPAAARGKIELHWGDNDSNEDQVIGKLLEEAIKTIFLEYFPSTTHSNLISAFESGSRFITGEKIPSQDYEQQLLELVGLRQASDSLVQLYRKENGGHREAEIVRASVLELILEGLHQIGKLNRTRVDNGTVFLIRK